MAIEASVCIDYSFLYWLIVAKAEQDILICTIRLTIQTGVTQTAFDSGKEYIDVKTR